MHSISWFWVFFGSGILILLNLILLFLIKEINVSIEKENTNNLFKDLFLELKNPKILLFLLIMVGFTTLYMQFYETLPNYIYDWINSNHLIEKLNLPEFLLSTNNFGKIIDFKWLYNINSGLIIIFIVPISFLLKKRKFSLAIIIGLSLVTIGLFLSGGFNLIEITFIGMGIYTFGEMIINPKIIEFMSKIGNENKRALYLGLINISFGLGLAIGSLLGGYIYKHFGEKSSLAQKYLYTYFPNELNINHSNALNRLMELKNIDFIEATELLYNYYHPNLIWIPFLIIGLISIVFFYLYKKRYNI
jgi:MFS family permease